MNSASSTQMPFTVPTGNSFREMRQAEQRLLARAQALLQSEGADALLAWYAHIVDKMFKRLKRETKTHVTNTNQLNTESAWVGYLTGWRVRQIEFFEPLMGNLKYADVRALVDTRSSPFVKMLEHHKLDFRPIVVATAHKYGFYPPQPSWWAQTIKKTFGMGFWRVS